MRIILRLSCLAWLLCHSAVAAEWPQFRGNNGTGVAEASGLPAEFGPSKNVVWKTDLPPGHSSPVIWGDRIFLTASEGGKRSDAGRDKIVDEGGRLYTICLERKSGRILWRREVPRPRLERFQPANSAASPSPVTDGKSVVVFFGDFGLISYSLDGQERWRLPLGPFNNVNGHGSSPILFENLVVMLCDQDANSYLLGVDKETGKVSYKVERPEATRSYSTPAILRPKDGPAEVIIPGAYQLTSYNARTGEKLWWIRGMSWQPKSTPVIDGDMIYAHWWEGGGEAETPTETPTFAEFLKLHDDNSDGRLTENEFAFDPRQQKGYYLLDLNQDKFVDGWEWEFYRARRASRNSLVAVKHGGRGDLTDTNVVWRMQKFLPNVPSPLLYQGVLYLVKDGGILTSLDPKTGRILRQGRLTGALDTYYSSPVGADGKVYLISQTGKATVVKAGGEWEILASSDLDDECYATPAFSGNRMYLRTRGALYCLGVPGN